MQLHQKHGDDVHCVTVSLDYYGDEKEAVQSDVLAMLNDKEISVTNIIQEDGGELDVQKQLQVAIPVVLVYQKNGELAHAFTNSEVNEDGELKYGKEGFNYEKHVIPFVEDLLQQPE